MSVTWLDERVSSLRSPSRRARMVGAGVVLAVVAALVGAGWWAWDTGRLDTREVVVSGTVRTDAQRVQDMAAAVAVGTPLVAVDVGTIHDEVAALPLVLGVAVERRWPRTLAVVVTERVAVATVPAAGGGFQVVDADGVVLEAGLSGPPPGVPLLRVDVDRDGAQTLEAARAVLEALPAELQARTSDLSATSPADVRLVVDGKQVRWGTAEDSARKVQVLTGLMADVTASVYDVSAPSAPALVP